MSPSRHTRPFRPGAAKRQSSVTEKSTRRGKARRREEEADTHLELGCAQGAEKYLSQEGVYHERKDEPLRVDHLSTKEYICDGNRAHIRLGGLIARTLSTEGSQLTVMLGLDLVM